MQLKPRETLAKWMAGRKFALTVAYWAFCFIGAAILYLFTCETVEQKIQVFNDALEWALYGFGIFAGVEGVKEMIVSRPSKTPKKPIEDEES
jgi:hypothetical protein